MFFLSRSSLFLAALLMAHEEVLGQAEGWRMVDRFSGFRFEVSGQVRDVGYMEAAQAKADELACFGWVQATGRDTVVGEARCSKSKGPLLKEWLQHGPLGAQVDKAEFRHYDDTKIRLHFSHFKILDEARVTCFKDTPHQCPEFERAEKTDRDPRDGQHEPEGQRELPVAEVGESATDRAASFGIRNEL